jgi:hypothetical protein
VSNRLLWKILPFLFIAYGGFRIWEWATHPPLAFSWNLAVGLLLVPYGLFRAVQLFLKRGGPAANDE